MNEQSDVSTTAPKVSVVIPAYNIAKYIAETLDSIFSQRVLPAEVIVVNDGSTDNTASIARARGAKVYDQDNRGLSAARNAGLSYASSEWIAFLDGDDLWAPTKLARQLDAASRDPSSSFLFTDFWQFNEHGTINRSVVHEVHSSYVKLKRTQIASGVWRFDQDELASFLPRSCIMVPSTWMIKRDLLTAIGGCDETLRYSEDIELELRLLANTPALFVDEPLVGYRRHGTAMSANQLRMRRGDIDVARRVYSNPAAYLGSTVDWFRLERATIFEKGGRMAVIYGEGDEARRLLSASMAAKPRLTTALWFTASFAAGQPFVTKILQRLKEFWFAMRPLRSKILQMLR